MPALAALRHAHFGVTLSIQNGPLKNEILTEVFGPARVLGALADTSGELLSDGTVLFTRNVNILVGELGGAESERAQRLARALDTAGVRAEACACCEIRPSSASPFQSPIVCTFARFAPRRIVFREPATIPVGVFVTTPCFRFTGVPPAASRGARATHPMPDGVRTHTTVAGLYAPNPAGAHTQP